MIENTTLKGLHKTFSTTTAMHRLLLAFFILHSTFYISSRASDSERESVRAILQRISHHQIHPLADGDNAPVSTLAALEAARPPAGISWNYPWGVTLTGLIRASDYLDDKSALDFVIQHNHIIARHYAFLSASEKKIAAAAPSTNADPNATGAAAPHSTFSILHSSLGGKAAAISGLLRLGNLDSCGAMGVQTLEAILRHPDRAIPEQKAIIERIADWVVNKQERLPDGTFWRPNSTDGDRTFNVPPEWPKGTIWIDDLYMGGVFLVRYYQYTHDPRHLTDAARQIIAMAAFVQDTDGLWFHGYSVPLKKHSPVKWARANGWAIVATVETLTVMPEDHPLRPQLLAILRRHIDGLKATQTPNGLWRQVLDAPALWEETSSTAMFAYAIARAANRGWIPPENLAIARRAFAAIAANYITPDGQVNGTCRGTNIAQTPAYYAARPRPDDELHGRGVVLLAGTELLASPRLVP